MTADTEGRISSFDIDALIDGGGFASFGHVTRTTTASSPRRTNWAPSTTPVLEVGPTNRLRVPCESAGVNTRCAVEVELDEMAESMKVDPIDLRLANLLPPHSRTISGFRITSNGMREALERVRDGSEWNTKFRQLPLGKGIGIGCGFFISGSGLPIHWDPKNFPHATVHIQVDMDGGVTVHTGAADWLGPPRRRQVVWVLALPLR